MTNCTRDTQLLISHSGTSARKTRQRLANALLGLATLGVIGLGSASAAPIVDTAYSSELQVSKISGSMFSTAGGSEAKFTHMSWGPDGRLYASTDGRGVLRFDYDSSTGSLSNMTQVSALNGLGVAFYGNQMFLTSNYTSPNDANPGQHFRLSSLWRLTSGDGGNTWGNAIPIVQGIPQHDHGANNIQIRGNTLTVGIGVRTRNGVVDVPFWFGDATQDTHGESAYGGTIMQIENLDSLNTQINNLGGGAAAHNVAGFYPANPTAAQYEAYIKGTDPNAKSIYTTTLDYKLKVHSAGTRNPYGLDIDGDGNIWFSNNWQRGSKYGYSKNPDDPAQPDDWDQSGNDGFQDDIHDQFFKAVAGGDYGYRNDNWRQDGVDGSGNPVSQNNAPHYFAGSTPVSSFTFDNMTGPDVDHNPANPDGLGPSSSANGFDIYDGNALPIKYHKKAFLARWNSTISDGGDTITYKDIVMIDLNTGAVDRVINSLANPLAVLTTPDGSLIVAEYGGDIYRVTPISAGPSTHGISWNGNANGNWSDYLKWTANSDSSVNIVPAQWGNAKYDVTINRAGVETVVTLDRSTTINDLTLAETLRLVRGNQLSLEGDLTQTADSDGIIFDLFDTSDYTQLLVDGLSDVQAFVIDVADGAGLQLGDTFDLLASDAGFVSGLPTLSVLDPGYGFDLSFTGGDTIVQATVTAVPEPAGMLALLGAAGLLLHRRRHA